MIEIQLTYNLVHKWKTENGVSVGSAFLNDTLLKENSLIEYFQSVKNETSLKEKLNKLSGHFSVVIGEHQQTFLLQLIPSEHFHYL